MARRRQRKPRQLELEMRTWGGRRKGAGRKPNARKAGVSHLKRPELCDRHPLHVTIRCLDGLPGLRTARAWRVIRNCIAAAHKDGFVVVEFSVMRNHLHLIVEASDRVALSRGMQGLKIRLARRLNRVWGRKGTVFADRYHARVLATPLEVRRALSYVLNNARRHAYQHGGHRLARRWVDPYSSADTFPGFRERWARAGPPDEVVRPARTWLLRRGWRRHGLLPVAEIPGRWSSG